MSENAFFTYKGRPLVRSGNTVYYGSMADKYIIIMQVLESEKVIDIDVAKRVLIQLWLTDEEVSMKDRVVKTSEKEGLGAALDIASAWLERYLKDK